MKQKLTRDPNVDSSGSSSLTATPQRHPRLEHSISAVASSELQQQNGRRGALLRSVSASAASTGGTSNCNDNTNGREVTCSRQILFCTHHGLKLFLHAYTRRRRKAKIRTISGLAWLDGFWINQHLHVQATASIFRKHLVTALQSPLLILLSQRRFPRYFYSAIT